MKSRQGITDSPKGEVGEIDTRAPFQSVKAAVSLFGEVAFTSDRSATRKPKPAPAERVLAKETELHLAQKELTKYKEQLNNAETTRIQALAELQKAKKTVEELTNKLNTINESKDLALKATEAAKGQTKLLEEVRSGENAAEDGAWKLELDNAREQYAVAITELDAAKQELRRFKKDFETSMEAKLAAFQNEAEAKQLVNANKEKAAQLSKDIAATQDSLVHVKLAAEQAQQEEIKIRSEKEAAKDLYKQSLEETETKLAFFTKDFDSEACKDLEAKLAMTTTETNSVKKELEDIRASDLKSAAAVASEVDGAKEVLQKMIVEESSLGNIVESLKLELEILRKEHAELRNRDAETESIVSKLQIKLQNYKAELEAALAAESKSASASDDLMNALQQLSAESQNAYQEAESMKKMAEELRVEAEAARVSLEEAEKKLEVSLKDAEEAKAAEARALDQIKDLSDKTTVARASTSESGANITISKEEFQSLSHKVEESEKLTEMKVAAAMAQIEAVKASEYEAIKRLEAVRKDMEDMESATEEALKRAEMAEAAKKAVEGELKRWREKEQKKAAETASRILAETQMTSDIVAPVPTVQNATPEKKSDRDRKAPKPSSSKKSLLPNLSGIFHRKSSNVGGSSPSYLPGEKPV